MVTTPERRFLVWKIFRCLLCTFVGLDHCSCSTLLSVIYLNGLESGMKENLMSCFDGFCFRGMDNVRLGLVRL